MTFLWLMMVMIGKRRERLAFRAKRQTYQLISLLDPPEGIRKHRGCVCPGQAGVRMRLIDVWGRRDRCREPRRDARPFAGKSRDWPGLRMRVWRSLSAGTGRAVRRGGGELRRWARWAKSWRG